MDPNENLRRQREIAAKIVRLRDAGADDDRDDQASLSSAIADLADELAGLVIALNDWIVRGGALPSSWSR
jgi:hypothetical protein